MKQPKLILSIAAAVALAAGLAGTAEAQRDPAYAAARHAGQIGEKPDGYLGVVGNQPAAIQKLVDSINIQRRAAYTKAAAAQGATIEDFAFTSGCNLIAQTAPGEKYQAPDGSWKTRTSAAPQRDSRCP
jgi:uncharacterized protein YdbL (DUF1318 family)